MKKNYFYVLLLVMGLLAVGCTKEEPIAPNDPNEEVEAPYTEGELFVKFSPEVTALIEQAGLTRSGYPTMDELLDLVGGYTLERVFPIDTRNEERTRECGLHQWYRVRFGSEQTAEEVAARLEGLGEVQKVDFNRTIKRAYSTRVTPLSMAKLQSLKTRATSGDPLRDLQWNLINRGDMFTSGEVVKSVKDADLQCEGAWEMSMGDESVVVAVLDEGICYDHPDLAANMWINPNETHGSSEDNDGNGYKGDYYGYNFVKDMGLVTYDAYTDSGHGSHVAGMVAAVNNNGEGISSVAGGDGVYGGVKVMSCQIFSGNNGTDSYGLTRAIKYAADNGAVVLQCSWGYISGAANAYDWGTDGFKSEEEWKRGAPLEYEVLSYFRHNAGSPNGPIDGGIAVFAGGNESAPMAAFPGAAADFVSVAGTAADFTAAVYTNYGLGTTISAPGGDQDYYYDYVDATHNFGEIGCILSTVPYHISESGYGYMEGTSMATPQVSGVVALGISYAAQLRRHFKAEELQKLLHATATPIDDYQTGKKLYYRYVSDLGPIQPMQMELSNYVGQMGSGQVNAEAFLRAIAGAEAPELKFPNLLLPIGKKQAVRPQLYFEEGRTLTYQVKLDDFSVARCTMQHGILLFEGTMTGSTTATITASNGQSQTFKVTVRKGDHDGWL